MSRARHGGRFAAFVFASLVCACGGAGDGDDPGAGLSVAPASVSFDYMEGGPFAGFKDVAVTITAQDAAYVVVGYPPGTTSEPTWLHLELSGSGASWTVRFSIWQNPPAGAYEATVRVVIARADQSVIGYEDVHVTYTVRRGVVASPSTLAFTQYKGSSTSTETKGLDVNGTVAMPFTASADQDWLLAEAWSGTLPALMYLTVDPAGLDLGTYETRITFLGGAQPTYVDVDVTVVPPVFWGFPSGPPNLVIHGTAGGVPVSNQLPITISTGQNAYPFQVTGTTPAWLQVSPVSGTVSSDSAWVTFTADAAALAAGDHVANVEVAVDVLGTTITLPVTVTCSLLPP